MNKWLKKVPFFPVIFAINTVLVLYLANYYSTSPNDGLRVLIIVLLSTLFTWLILQIIIKNVHKTAIILFIILAVFCSFQNIVNLFRDVSALFIDQSAASRFWASNRGQLVVGIFLFVTLVMVIFLVTRSKKFSPNLILYMNLVSIILLAFSLIQGINTVRKLKSINGQNRSNFSQYWQGELKADRSTIKGKTDQSPDIYYIILDGFARSDILQKLYGYDNSDFLQGLEERGFYVASQSYANYSQTRLSLASSMNLTYLDDLVKYSGEDKSNPLPAQLIIQNSLVEQRFRDMGYELVGYKSDISFTNFTDWDLFFTPEQRFNGFALNYINSTLISVILNPQIYEWHRQGINFVLESLPDISDRDGKQFIFAHILCPHPPFVFHADGSSAKVDRLYFTFDADGFKKFGTIEEYRTGYVDQVKYMQSRILEIFDEVSAKSNGPFIFIIQADHGPGMNVDQTSIENSDVEERLAILNAIYFSDQKYDALYPSISPVNTFRVVFSQYFGLDEPVLPDVHYFSLYQTPFDFIPVDQLLR